MKQLHSNSFNEQVQRKLQMVRKVICQQFDITENSLLEKRPGCTQCISDLARLSYIYHVVGYYHGLITHAELANYFLFPWKCHPYTITSAKFKAIRLMKEDIDFKAACDKVQKEIIETLDA